MTPLFRGTAPILDEPRVRRAAARLLPARLRATATTDLSIVDISAADFTTSPTPGRTPVSADGASCSTRTSALSATTSAAGRTTHHPRRDTDEHLK